MQDLSITGGFEAEAKASQKSKVREVRLRRAFFGAALGVRSPGFAPP